MAGDWIKVENVTPDKPEVFQLAEILQIDPDAVTGKLLRIWIWADEQTIDGNAKGVTRLLLDRLAGVTGFANAMLQTPWLEDEDGQLVFSNFDRHNGKGAKKRSESNRRVSNHREKLKQECNVESVTKVVTREEKRREENTYTSSDVSGVFSYWQERMGKPLAKLDPSRKSKIQTRLKNYSSGQLKKAIDGCASSEYHMGQNDSNKQYNTIDLIFRNDSKTEEFIDLLSTQREQSSGGLEV